MENFRPLHDQVLIKRLEPEKVTKGGLILHAIAQQENDRAVVQAVGPGYPKPDGTVRPLSVKVGDVVIVQQYAGVSMQADASGVALVKENQIMAVDPDYASVNL